MIKIKRIEKLENISRGTWSEALRLTRENYVFQTYEFISSWWNYFGRNKNNKQLLLLAVEKNNCIVAIAPLMITRVPFINKPVIKFIGGDICDYMDFIIDYRNYADYFLKIIEYLSNLKFLEIDLKYIPEDSDTLQNFTDLNRIDTNRSRICQIDACPYIRLENKWQEVEENLNNKLKSEIYKNEKRMQQEGDLVFRSYFSESPPQKILEDYFDLHIKRWRYYSNKYSQFQYKYWRDFVISLSISLAERGWLDFSYLEFNKKMIACHFGFRYNNKLYYYMPAFDPEFAAYSPSKILMMKMIEKAAREGLGEFDFLRGQESYKMAWTELCRSVYSVRYYSKLKFLRYSGLIYRSIKDGYAQDIKPRLKKIRPLMNLWYKSKGDF